MRKYAIDPFGSDDVAEGVVSVGDVGIIAGEGLS